MFDLPIFIDTKMTGKKWAEYQNWTTFVNILEQLMTLALERYDVDGLPETCDKRTIKLSLLWYGCVCIYSGDKTDSIESLISLPAKPNATYTIYGDAASCFVYAKNGQISTAVDLHIPGSEKNPMLGLLTGGSYAGDGHGILIWENERRFPFIRYVFQYAKAMADCLRTIDVSRKYIKTPLMVIAEESKVPTVKKYLEAIDRNEPVIIGSDSLRDDDVHIEPITTASEGAKTALELYDWYANKFYELCGYASNGQIDKKGENLITAEVTSNEEIEDSNLNKVTDTLNRYADYCNDFFGTNIKFKSNYVDNVSRETEVKDDDKPDDDFL